MLEAKAFYGTPPPAEPVVSVINKNIPRADFLHGGCFKQNLNQFDDRHFGGVAAAHTSLDDTGVTAVAVGVFRADLVDDLLCHALFRDEAVHLTLRMQVFTLWSRSCLSQTGKSP